MITVSEFSLLHEVFSGIIERELRHPVPLPQEVRELIGRKSSSPDLPASESCAHWLALLDLAISAHKLRGYVATEDPGEPTLLALVRFLVFKRPHSEIDRDKVDWLFTHLFKKREERRGSPTGWPRKEIQEILAGVEFPPLGRETQDQLMDVPALLDEIKYFTSFHQITDSRAVQTATVPNPVTPVHLQDWETGAFRSQYPEAEKTFRAQFAREVSHAIAIISRIYDEIPSYLEKKGTEFHWKMHYDALVFLLYEGRRHKELLVKLSASSSQRGLHQKAKQLQATAEKLDVAVERAAGVF